LAAELEAAAWFSLDLASVRLLGEKKFFCPDCPPFYGVALFVVPMRELICREAGY